MSRRENRVKETKDINQEATIKCYFKLFIASCLLTFASLRYGFAFYEPSVHGAINQTAMAPHSSSLPRNL